MESSTITPSVSGGINFDSFSSLKDDTKKFADRTKEIISSSYSEISDEFKADKKKFIIKLVAAIAIIAITFAIVQLLASLKFTNNLVVGFFKSWIVKLILAGLIAFTLFFVDWKACLILAICVVVIYALVEGQKESFGPMKMQRVGRFIDESDDIDEQLPVVESHGNYFDNLAFLQNQSNIFDQRDFMIKGEEEKSTEDVFNHVCDGVNCTKPESIVEKKIL